ncbi:hypothetical protein L3Q65_30805 [Amycolatopsis sp. FU40]|uniref:hypothetical protein n=1 Tax=Amycolatopsis sp. FU40 TaxID=2914159 RepID=UPI001F414A7A|nr:hypothetical protein [Amycolatopsis sp. FU40]UKD52286.1 hypothetical protein L3Q65_30805 [Amycolatopsis sp. FU40]
MTARTRAALVPAILLSLAACGSTDVAGTPGPAAPPPSTAPKPSEAEPASGAPAYQTAVERWVTQILQKHYEKACLSSAPVLPPGKDAKTLCKSPAARKSAESLHDAWAKPGVTLPPQGKVTVDEVSTSGDQVTVPDTAVKLDGRTLRSLELIGSTGNTSSFSLAFKVQKHEGAWYVQGFDLNA